MEKNELSRIPDPDDPNDPVMPTDNANSYIGSNVGSAPLNTFKERVRTAEVDFIERGNKINLKSSSAAKPARRRIIEKLENEIPYDDPNDVPNGGYTVDTVKERPITSEVQFFERGNKEFKNDRRWNRNMATLKTVYFGDIWTGTATVAAVMLLVLTFIQAVYFFL